VNTASGRLHELTRFLNWLTRQGIYRLDQIGNDRCEQYLAHRRYLLDDRDEVIGERGPATRRAAAQAVVDLVNHREPFTTDRVPERLRPWGGAAPSTVAEMPSGVGQNKTPPVGDTVLQPLLAAATYLTTILGPHAVQLAGQLHPIDPARRSRPQHVDAGMAPLGPVDRITSVLNQYVRRGEPLPQLLDHHIQARLAQGWHPADPLLTLSWDVIARQAGYWQMPKWWAPQLRHAFEEAVARVGITKSWARHAELVARADGQGQTAWSEPLHRVEAADPSSTVSASSSSIGRVHPGRRGTHPAHRACASETPPCMTPSRTHVPDLEDVLAYPGPATG
jgi:hypothetical protein